MTTPPTFPSLPGLAWPVPKKPVYSTVVAQHVSGREVRTALYQNPIWEFELSFEGLAGDAVAYPGLGANSLQQLMNLFMACQGSFGTFLYADPTDSAVTAGPIATGDGATETFSFARALVSGGVLEPVGWVTSVANVYLAGVNQISGWSLANPNSLVFASPPGSGVAVTASFAYAFQCRFDDDSADFEQFMHNLWELKSLKFRSVRGF